MTQITRVYKMKGGGDKKYTLVYTGHYQVVLEHDGEHLILVSFATLRRQFERIA